MIIFNVIKEKMCARRVTEEKPSKVGSRKEPRSRKKKLQTKVERKRERKTSTPVEKEIVIL